MRITKEQLKKIIKEELENIDEGADGGLASQLKAIQGSLKGVMRGLNQEDQTAGVEQLDHIINVVFPNLIKNLVMNRQ